MTKLADASTIHLLERDKALAELSKDNGFTKVWGKNADGNPVEMSTSDFPDIQVMQLATEDSSYRRLGEIARNDVDEQEN